MEELEKAYQEAMKVFADPFDPHWTPPPIDVKEVRQQIGEVRDISELSDKEVVQLEKEIRILAAMAYALGKEDDLEELSES